MRDIEHRIAEWRLTMTGGPEAGPEALDELENHLRESMAQLVQSGVDEGEAFQRAVTQLGTLPTIGAEFQKLNHTTWLPIKVVIGVGLALILGLVVMLFLRLGTGRSGFLLVAHVFAVTLGYTATLLTGFLGICYVCQRCFAEFSSRQVQTLARFSFRLTSFAAALTAAGIVLGMVWTRIEWGRFWDWDPKEIGALCVIIWQIGFVATYRSCRATAHDLLLISILGNIIVTLGWFGANLMSSAASYGQPNYWWIVLTGIIASIAFFGLGLAPARSLPFRKV